MTEKRFELRLCSNGLYYLWCNNELSDIYFDKFNKECANELVECLNNLHEENEQLKLDLKVERDGGNLYKDLCEALEKENEQLKKEYREIEIKVGKLKGEIGELFCENEQLKQQLKECEQKKQNIKELLMYGEAVVEQKKLQELIYGQVIALIDDKIKEYKKYDGYDTETYYIGTQLLKELKKELRG